MKMCGISPEHPVDNPPVNLWQQAVARRSRQECAGRNHVIGFVQHAQQDLGTEYVIGPVPGRAQ